MVVSQLTRTSAIAPRSIDVVAQDDQTFSIAVDDTAERAWGALVSGNYFEVMGLRAGRRPLVHRRRTT